MRIVNCLIGILFTQLCTAQQVVRKVVNSPNRVREVYYVLASDSSRLHGRYIRTENAGRTEGFYNNGLQDGIWTVYATAPKKFIRVQGPFKDGKRNGLWTVYNSKKKLKTKGFFKDDERIGFWRFYNDNGELEEEGNFNKDLRVGKWSFYDDKGNQVQEFDYSTRKLVSDISLAGLQQKPFRVIRESDTINSLLQRPPVYIGGRAKLNTPKIIQYTMRVDSVKVEIDFTIDKTGLPHDYNIVKSMGYPYDQEAMYTLRQLPATWLPAILNGEPVDVRHTVTIMFRKVTMKREPLVYYRNVLRNSTIRNPWDPSSQSFGNQYPNSNYIPPPVLSFQACKIQIL